MLNSKSTNRLDDLIQNIAQARKSLAEWESQKTEALIQFDSLTYDLRILDDEKNKIAETNDRLRLELQDQTKIYHSHVENLSDQVQMLKIEKDEVQQELAQAKTQIQNLHEEMESRRLAFARLEIEQRTKVAEARTEVEMRMAEETLKLRTRISEINLHVENLQSEKSEAERRAMNFEKELNAIRGQMLNALRPKAPFPRVASQSAAAVEATAAPANIVQEVPMDMSNVLSAQESENDIETVESYLKRFGY